MALLGEHFLNPTGIARKVTYRDNITDTGYIALPPLRGAAYNKTYDLPSMTDYKLVIHPPTAYTYPSYFTTLAVFVGESRLPESTYIDARLAAARTYMKDNDSSGAWTTNNHITEDQAWFVFDPSSSTFANYLTKQAFISRLRIPPQ
jgi:hypothetical protein